ncbi:D-aspartate oxidase-like [Babylonia areolata]|uniref:D-aspartate oxidase-like n=1 Tax=Babylonia areolata TaxID=304850 RepID=UPI003FD22B31
MSGFSQPTGGRGRPDGGAKEPRNMRRVCVIGAGVIGLSTAVRVLEESGKWGEVEVTVVADRFSPHTTSDGSGGFWEPFTFGDTPLSLIRKWSDATWKHMQGLALSGLASTLGAQFSSGYHMSDSSGDFSDVSYKDTVLGFRQMSPKEMGFFPMARSGIFMTTVQINVQKYLPWLMQRFKDAGGKTEFRTVQSLSEVAEDYDVIVNCAGPRAGLLTSDPHTLPIRGQLRRVHAPWVKHFYLFQFKDGRTSYLLPLGDVLVVGGVVQEHNWNEEVDSKDSEEIWTQALSVYPFLKGGRTVLEWAGLRPGRSAVRLEADKVITGSGRPVPVIHNYGHGGSGVTLHWGCAADAADLVRSALRQTPAPTHSKL